MIEYKWSNLSRHYFLGITSQEAVDRRDTPRDVFWPGHGPVPLRSSYSPPPLFVPAAFISLRGFGSDVLFPAFSQERDREGALSSTE